MEKIVRISYNIYLLGSMILCIFTFIENKKTNEKLKDKLFKIFKYNVVAMFAMNILYAYYVTRNDGLVISTIIGALFLLKSHNSMQDTKMYFKDKEIEVLKALLNNKYSMDNRGEVDGDKKHM